MRASAYRFGHGRDVAEAYAVLDVHGPWAMRSMTSNVHRLRSDPRDPRSWSYVHDPCSDRNAHWSFEEAMRECSLTEDEELVREIMLR